MTDRRSGRDVFQAAAPRRRARIAGWAAVVCALAGFSANAQEWGLQMGPTGPGTGGSTDREFIKEWEGNPPPGFATLSPANIAATNAAIKQYTQIVAAGGWKVVPEIETRSGQTHFAVSVLCDRLAASGDLKDAAAADEFFDATLETAVKHFQATNGLTPTGIADARTIAALNVPAAGRLKQLKNNVARLQEYASLGKKRIDLVVQAQKDPRGFG